MQFSSKLFFATLGALLAARTAISAPVYADDLTADMEMAEDFSISGLRNALSKAAGVVQKIATVAKPIVDTISKVASVTPLAPEAGLLDTAVTTATKIPVGDPPAAAPAALASVVASLPFKAL